MDTTESNISNITQIIFNELLQRTPLIKDIAEIILSYRNEPVIKGEFALKIGSRGNGRCQFHEPIGIRTNGKYLYVCDSINGRIQKIDIKNQDKENQFFECTPINVGFGCTEPYDIAIHEPYMYVTSLEKCAVFVFEISTGKFIREMCCDEETCDLNIYIHNSLLYTCFSPYQIEVYTLEGNFVKTIEPENISIFGCELFCTSLFVTDDDIYICCCDIYGNDNNIICLTIEGDYKFCLNKGSDKYLSVHVTEDSVYIGGNHHIAQYDRYGKFIRNIGSDHIIDANGIVFIGNQCFVTDMHNSNICVFK